jgi:hypothetical protein
MSHRYRAVYFLMAGLLFAPSARAHSGKPSIVLHIASTQDASCNSAPSDLNNINTAMPETGDYVAYVMVNVPNSDYTGMDHFNFGAWYEEVGLQVNGWHSCAERAFPSSTWPAAGSDITLSWGTCENRATFVAGWFDITATGPSTLSLTGGEDRTVWMAGCGLRSFSLDQSDLGWASFAGGANDGDPQGCNAFAAPCYYGKLPPVSHAFEPRDNAIVLHVAPDDHNTCFDAPTSSEQVVTRAPADGSIGGRYNVYVIGVPKSDDNASWGLAGIEFGIDYSRGKPGSEALVVHSWTSCSDMEFSADNWPQAGTGNILTWVSPENCQTAMMVPAGYFTVSAYAPSSMALIPNPVSAAMKIANCDGVEAVIENYVKPARVGWVSMRGGLRNSSSDGCNPLLEPCDATVPVQPTTWGKMKALYAH